jgi:hypothetical protein
MLVGELHQTGLSTISSVCHQPQATFLGRQPGIETRQGMFLSTESPKPSCTGRQSLEIDYINNTTRCYY